MKIEIDFKNLKKNYDKKIIRRFKDMKESFKNSQKIKGNPLLYKVYIKDFGNFETGLTVIESGDINGEYYMTKGHKHKKLRKEIYFLINGKGKLILQEGKNSKVLDLKKNKFYQIPEKTGHRLINTGKNKLEVLTIYSKDSGHDYNFEFKKRIFRKVV